MTTNKTRYGVYGVAAIVAILSLSLVATSFTTQEATAEAARKAGMSMEDTTISTAITVEGAMVPLPDKLGQITLKSNDKGDWMVEGVIECATAIQAKAKGKHSADDPLTGGTAGAKVWITMDAQPSQSGNGNDAYSNMISVTDGEVTDDLAEAQWNLCQQTFEMKSNFNDLIITCEEALEINSEYAGCNEDFNDDGTVDSDPNKLVYLCDVDTEEIECEQSLEVFTAVAGTHPIAYMLHNVEAADTHVIEIWAELSAGPSSNSSINQDTGIIEGDVNPDTENFVDAGVVIGKRLFSVETLAYQG